MGNFGIESKYLSRCASIVSGDILFINTLKSSLNVSFEITPSTCILDKRSIGEVEAMYLSIRADKFTTLAETFSKFLIFL